MNSSMILSLLMVGIGMAQAQQPSRAYRTMLDALYKKTVPIVTVAALKKTPDVVLLDTRSKEEYDVSHLPNARWVGYNDFDLKRVANIPKGANVVMYCSVGVRSERIGWKVMAAGYQYVYNLYGSLFDWAMKKTQL